MEGVQAFLKRYEALRQEKQKGKDEFVVEFEKVKKEAEKLVRSGKSISTEGAKDINRKKNRYKDILPFDHSRVILKKFHDFDGSDYINASYIKSPDGKKGYIASQGPMPSTVNDFWRMIWQHKVKVIVMACKEIELGKHRCQRYWSRDGEKLNFNDIEVTLISEELVEDNLTERKLKAVQGDEELFLTQIHYTAWPDHGAPRSSKDIIRLVEIMRENHPWDDPPVLVHCSAGCGRTGAIIAIDYGRRMIRKSPPKFNVFDIVMTLRRQRPAMVQSKDQYEYLHEVYKDLIIDHVKNSNRPAQHASYVNIDFTPAEVSSIYENFDHSPRQSPTGQRRIKQTPVATNASTGIFVTGDLGEARKPIITNNMKVPQKATYRHEVPQLPPKTASKPTNLIDYHSIHDFNDLQAPLQPVQINCVEMKKPGYEKDSNQQNYINVDIEAPKVPKKSSSAGSVSTVDFNQSEAHDKSVSLGRGLDMKTEKKRIKLAKDKKTNSFETLLEIGKDDPCPPKIACKPRTKGMVSSKSLDDLDGEKPPLPLKNKDLAEFDVLLGPNKYERSEFEREKVGPILRPRSDLPKKNKTEKAKEALSTSSNQYNQNYETLSSTGTKQEGQNTSKISSLQNTNRRHENQASRSENNNAKTQSTADIQTLALVRSSESLDKKSTHHSKSPVTLNSVGNMVKERRSEVHIGKANPPLERPMIPARYSEDKTRPLEESQVSLVAINSGDLYASVEKSSNARPSDGLYETVWSPKKPPSNNDAPPALPARTADSFVVMGEELKKSRNSCNAEDDLAVSESPPTSATNDQSWLSAGVDKLKKLNIKSAFTLPMRPSHRPAPSASIMNSAFYASPSPGNSVDHPSPQSPESNLGFGYRLQHKPKGPRKMPTEWSTVKNK